MTAVCLVLQAKAVLGLKSQSIPASQARASVLWLKGGNTTVRAVQASKDVPAVKEMLAVAHRVLGYDLLKARAAVMCVCSACACC